MKPWSPSDETSVLNIACCVLSVCLLFLNPCIFSSLFGACVCWSFGLFLPKRGRTSLSSSSVQQFHTFEHLNLKTGNVYSPSRQHSRVLDGSHNVVNWRNPFPVARASGRREDGLLRDNGKAGFLMAACGEEEEGWGHPQCVHPPHTTPTPLAGPGFGRSSREQEVGKQTHRSGG